MCILILYTCLVSVYRVLSVYGKYTLKFVLEFISGRCRLECWLFSQSTHPPYTWRLLKVYHDVKHNFCATFKMYFSEASYQCIQRYFNTFLQHTLVGEFWIYAWGVCPKNVSFKIFVVVIPKEWLVDRALPNIILVWHQLCNITCKGCRLQIYRRYHTKRKIGVAMPANPSFVMTTTKIFKDAFLWHATHFLYIIRLTEWRCKYNLWVSHMVQLLYIFK